MQPVGAIAQHFDLLSDFSLLCFLIIVPQPDKLCMTLPYRCLRCYSAVERVLPTYEYDIVYMDLRATFDQSTKLVSGVCSLLILFCAYLAVDFRTYVSAG